MGYKLLKTLELDYPMFQFLIIEKHVGIHALAFHWLLTSNVINLSSDLGEYEQHVWYLRFVSAFLGSLVVPIVYEVGIYVMLLFVVAGYYSNYCRTRLTLLTQGTSHIKRFLNTERSYKRQGHATLKHFVGFLCNGGKPK